MNRSRLPLAVLLLIAACVVAAVAAGHGRSDSPAARSCGTATVRGPNDAAFTGSSSLRCFALAVTQCRPASLRVTETGVDGGEDVTATVEPGTPCRARYVHNSYSGNFGGSEGPKETTQCNVSATGGKVSFSCPDMSDDIPAS